MQMRGDKPVIVVLSGAGISRESGLKTFRDADGLWEGYRVEEVATPEAWAADPELVLGFYNQRRRQLDEVMPNAAHRALAALEDAFDVRIVTQNVDDLHERAGSTQVLHLHGQLRVVRPEDDPGLAPDRWITVGEAALPALTLTAVQAGTMALGAAVLAPRCSLPRSVLSASPVSRLFSNGVSR